MTARAKFLRADEGHLIEALGSAMNVKATSRETDGAYDVVVVDSGPGGDIVPHRHPWAELYFVLEGTMEVQVGRQLHTAAAGDFVNIPARALHGFRVTSASARFLHVSAGSGAVEAFEDFAANVPQAPTIDDLDALLAVNARHGIELVVPTGA